jgi:hypothetical protein
MLSVGANTFDLKWGALNEGSIDEAKLHFADFVNQLNAPVTESVMLSYRKVFSIDQKELYLAVRKELLAFTKEKINEILFTEIFKKKPTWQFLEKKFMFLEYLGITFMSDFYLKWLKLDQTNERANLIAKDVIRHFNKGIPTSFPMMAKLLGSQKIADHPIDLGSFSDAKISLKVLKRLAELGEPEAQKQLLTIFVYNKIGKNNLGRSIQERFEIVMKLALAGYPKSQKTLVKIFNANKLNDTEVNFLTKKQCLKWTKKLRQTDSQYNSFLASKIILNQLNETLPLNLTLEERFDYLVRHAKQGNKKAFRDLFNVYATNQMGNDRLTFSQKERLEKLHELKELNPQKWQNLFAKIYCDNTKVKDKGERLEPCFSSEERIKWLEDQAFHHHNKKAQNILADAYRANTLGPFVLTTDSNPFRPDAYVKLNLSFHERFYKILTLADQGNKKAQIALQFYFLFKRKSDAIAFTFFREWYKNDEYIEWASDERQLSPILFKWVMSGNRFFLDDVLNNHLNNRYHPAVKTLFMIRIFLQEHDSPK